MKALSIVCWLAGCFWLIFLTGCARNLQIVHCPYTWPEEVVKTKVSEINAGYASRNGARTEIVGTMLMVSQYVERDGVDQEGVYERVSGHIIPLLEKAGVTSCLISNRDDPKLENVDYILHVNYQETLSGSEPANKAATFASTYVPFFVPVLAVIAVPVAAATDGHVKQEIGEAYEATMHDLRSGKSYQAYRYSVDEVIQNVKEWIGIWKDEHEQQKHEGQRGQPLTKDSRRVE
jgi:hypothetical protein